MRQVTALLAWGALVASPVAAFAKRELAEESWKPAVETAAVRPEVDQNQVELGWSPRPTEAAELYGRYAGMKFERADENTLGSDTCGFNGGGSESFLAGIEWDEEGQNNIVDEIDEVLTTGPHRLVHLHYRRRDMHLLRRLSGLLRSHLNLQCCQNHLYRL